MKLFSRTLFCFAVLTASVLPTDLLYGQVTYTITGFVDFESAGAAPEVSIGEGYIAEFEVDLSVPDSDPDDPNRGVYPNAILSSSIVFSGGYTSQIDFAGGEITIIQDLAGGGVFLDAPGELGIILVADVGDPFDSDALLSDLGGEFLGDPQGDPLSLFSLSEPSGNIFSGSTAPELGFGPILLSVTATSSNPVLMGDINLDGAVTFDDIPPFITTLATGSYQEEADFDQNASIDFNDIPPFVEALTSQ